MANNRRLAQVGSFVGSTSSDKISFQTNTGIGTTNPTSRLTVDGDTLVTGVITATNFSGDLNTSGVVTATTFSGNISGVAATFTGNVTIGGTLTYEDVTNIDAIGLITARNGLQVLSGITTISGMTELGNVFISGIVTSTTFSGQINAGVGTITTLSGTTGTITNVNSTNLSGTIGTISTLNSTSSILTNINSSGISTLSTAIIGSAVTINNGGINATGVVTATSFVKSGGTSSQFLKADGSVDSSTYLQNIVEDTTPQLGGNLDINGKYITGTGGVNITGVVTATTFSGSGANLTNIPTTGLTTNTVSYGGVTLTLGGSDATPAFNLADATGLPVSSGISGLGANVATFLATPSSANLASAVTGETGSGALVFATSPTLVTPALGQASATSINATGVITATTFDGSLATSNLSGTITNDQLAGSIANEKLVNSSVSYGGVSVSLGSADSTPAFNLADASGLPVSTGISGLGANVATFLATPSSSNLAAAVTGETGSGALVFATSPTLVTPILGQASATSLSASGIVTATGGFNLGISSAGTSITSGSPVTTLNFIGAGNTFAFTGTTVDISIAGGGVSEVETTVSTTSATGVGSFAVATYRSADVIAQISQGSNYQVGRYLMIHDGTTVTVVEESSIATGSMLGSFNGVINGANAELRVTLVSAGTAATVTTKIDTVTIP